MIERHGLDAELNPIVVALADNVGLIGLTLVKVGAVAFLGGLWPPVFASRGDFSLMHRADG